MLSEYIINFINYNSKLIDKGDIFLLMNRCHRDYRTELEEVLTDSSIEGVSYSKPKVISDPDVFEDTLKEVMTRLNIDYDSHSITTGPGMTYTYQFVDFDNPYDCPHKLEQIVCDELDKLNVWYDYVDVNPRHVAWDYKTDTSHKTNKLKIKMHH